MDMREAIQQAIRGINEGEARLEVRSIGLIRNAVYSYDKARYAVLGEGILQVWRAKPLTWERTFALPSHDHNPGLAFSRDGTWIAVSDRGTIWRCDLSTGEITSFCPRSDKPDEERDPDSWVDALGFAEDGRLVQVDAEGKVFAWDDEGHPAPADDLRVDAVREDDDGVPGVARIEGQDCVRDDVEPRYGIVHELEGLHFLSSTLGSWGTSYSPAFSPDGRWLLVPSRVDSWSPQPERLLYDLNGESWSELYGALEDEMAAFSSDSQLVAFLSETSSVIVAETETDQKIAELRPPEGGGATLSAQDLVFWGSDLLTVLWVDDEGTPSPVTYRLPSGEPIPRDTPAEAYPAVGAIALARPGHERISAWHGITGEEVLNRPQPDFTCAALGPDGTVVSVGENGDAQVWPPGQPDRRFQWPDLREPHRIEWLPDGETLLITCPAGFGWYRTDGEALGFVPLTSVERVSFQPGQRLTAFLTGGLILRWIF